MKIYMIREGDRFRPLSEADLSNMRRVKEGQIIYVEYKKPRNPLFHNKFMSMVRVVFSNQEQYETIEQVMNVIKVGIGHCDMLAVQVEPEGMYEVKIPKSIAFHNMDEIAFNEFYDKAVEFCLSQFLPTVTKAELEEYVNQIASYAG